MTISIKCSQLNPQYGTISVNIRFINKLIYMKFSNKNPQQQQMIKQLEEKGAKIVYGESDWIQIDIFNENKVVKLGGIEFDVDKTTNEEVEQILYDFYKEKYLAAKFTVEDIK